GRHRSEEQPGRPAPWRTGPGLRAPLPDDLRGRVPGRDRTRDAARQHADVLAADADQQVAGAAAAARRPGGVGDLGEQRLADVTVADDVPLVVLGADDAPAAAVGRP